MLNNEAKERAADHVDEIVFSTNPNSTIDNYILGKQIGQGAYAVVRIGVAKQSNQKLAIKIYDKSKLSDINRRKSVRREIKLMERMRHNNIVKLFEAIETES